MLPALSLQHPFFCALPLLGQRSSRGAAVAGQVSFWDGEGPFKIIPWRRPWDHNSKCITAEPNTMTTPNTKDPNTTTTEHLCELNAYKCRWTLTGASETGSHSPSSCTLWRGSAAGTRCSPGCRSAPCRPGTGSQSTPCTRTAWGPWRTCRPPSDPAQLWQWEGAGKSGRDLVSDWIHHFIIFLDFTGRCLVNTERACTFLKNKWDQCLEKLSVLSLCIKFKCILDEFWNPLRACMPTSI